MKNRILMIACLLVLICLILVLSLPVRIMGAGSQAYTWKNVKIEGGGGYIPGIVFNTTQQNLVYARTDMGGAYRSTDGGNTWTQLLNWVSYDDWSLAGVDSLATDPVDPNRLYLQCGMYSNSWGTNGAILRSTDKGNTFQRVNLPFKVGGNMPGRNMGERLAIDPNKNSILFMGTREGQGLWKSTDYGVTWNKVTGFPNPGTYVQDPNDVNDYLNHNPGVVWVTFDKRTGTSGNATPTIYVGVADLGTSIYRSVDGGATWSAVPGQPTGMLPQHGKLSSTGILYVSYSDTQGPYDGAHGDVWKFDTATGAWTMISPVPSADTSNCYFGYGGLAIDPQNPNTIMVASLDSWWPDTYIWRSTDAGATWSPIWYYNGYPTRINRYTLDWSATPWIDFGETKQAPETSPKLGAMIGSLEIDPFNSNRFMIGNGGCIWGCDNTNNWDAGTMVISIKSIGMEETSVLSLVSPPTGPNLVSGIGDIAGFIHTDLTKSQKWTFVQPNLTSNTCIDFAENNPQFWVRCGNVDKSYKSDNRTGFSYASGTSWFQGNTEPSGMPTSGGGGMIAANADGTAVVYAAGSDSVQVCYSTDNGNTWIPVQGGVPNNSKVRSDRVNPSKFYAFKAGAFYMSTDKGKTFTKSAATGLPTEGTGNFKTVFGREGDIWIASGGTTSGIYGMWHSTDSGATFTKLANVEQADSIGFGMAAPGQTYPAIYTNAKIDGVRGFFRSDDGGTSWIRINDDANQFGNANADITGDRRIYGRVYVATNGFGIKWGDPNGPTPTPVRGTPTPTVRATATPTNTPTPTLRATATPTPTNRVTPTSRPSSTPTVTRRVTITNTPTPTTRRTVTNTPTPTRRGIVTNTPTPTSRVTVTNTPTPTRGTGNYVVAYVISSDWGNGATASVTITNNSASAVNGWTLAFIFPGNQTITNLWNGTYTQSGASVNVKDAGFNGAIGANGGSVNFGFNFNYSGTNAKPASFTLNGVACQLQ